MSDETRTDASDKPRTDASDKPRTDASDKPRMRVNPRITERIAKAIIWSAALLVMVVLLAIIIYILIKGLPVIDWQFLTENPHNMGRDGGVFSTIIGTLMVVAVAIIIAVPFGIGTAFYLAEYTREGLFTRIVRFSAESLAGIPSIVYGLFGFLFFVIYLDLGWSVLSGGLTLAVMILPTIIRTSEEAIITVPRSYREVSFSLGGTKWQTTLKAVFPSALRGVANGIILSIGRCIAETAAVVLTAGSTLRMPTSLFSPTRTMAVHFYILAREGISMENAYGTAALLIILIFIINVVVNALIDRFVAKNR
ncbi:MAG: phosphate ABC transporter permease PstA [Coriobacteriales bacterium]|nr:phosphate ABC transporter permease PstA [Coriobacteriales bacterium]